MKIAVVCRVYNEIEIIKDFLDHYRSIATGGFYIYDDGSTDGTFELLQEDDDVKHVIKGIRPPGIKSHFRQNPQRKEIINYARKHLRPDDYFLLLDADEFIDFHRPLVALPADLINFALFDLYTTEPDEGKNWKSREFVGPEVRYIGMLVKNKSYADLKNDRTIVSRGLHLTLPDYGYVKHIGKAINRQYWDRKCNHYSRVGMPVKYKLKWEQRKGKYIHKKSDFGRDLIKWGDLDKHKEKWVKID